jgi:hypothetical protein
MVDYKQKVLGNDKTNPVNMFSSNILKTIVGPDKALQAFQSISMGGLPNSSKAQAALDNNHLIGA